MNLGDCIEAYLKEQKMSYRQLASEIGCDHSTLHRMARGEPVRVDTLIRLLVWMLSNKHQS